MSVRGIGEGHCSSIGFRTGVVDSAGSVVVDDAVPFTATGSTTPPVLDAAVFRGYLAQLRHTGEIADYVLNALGDRFSRSDLDARLAELHRNRSTRQQAAETIDAIRAVADRAYGVVFPEDTALSERVLWPATSAEAAGMEDARFVRFVDDDGSITFYASYTAYSGNHISQQLLATTDFRTFTSVPMVGPAAANKGLALFPRAASAGDTRPCRDRIASPTPSPSPITSPCGRMPLRASSPWRRGRRCNWAIAARPSRPTPGGWCSPTVSARCARTASGRSCSTCRTRPGSSVVSPSRC